ncbi:hypothetical protein VNO77_05332 [Canavalia gladiata]|uniref:Uncharacterized protein n=1 Tax=Canavalia gladiata TaxID=3824 RepID=A0AAN9R5K1_CANGL
MVKLGVFRVFSGNSGFSLEIRGSGKELRWLKIDFKTTIDLSRTYSQPDPKLNIGLSRIYCQDKGQLLTAVRRYLISPCRSLNLKLESGLEDLREGLGCNKGQSESDKQGAAHSSEF